MSKKKLCPCCSQKEYDQCCRLFHEGKLPMRPLELMRSRYSAYALNFPDYIMETTHPANPYYSKDTLSWRRSISEFSKSSSFEKLEILATSEKEATVTFTAYIIQDSKDLSFTEKSYFEKVGGRWLYRDGELFAGCKKLSK